MTATCRTLLALQQPFLNVLKVTPVRAALAPNVDTLHWEMTGNMNMIGYTEISYLGLSK